MHTTSLSLTEMVRGFSDYVNRLPTAANASSCSRAANRWRNCARFQPAGCWVSWKLCCGRCQRSVQPRPKILLRIWKRRARSFRARSCETRGSPDRHQHLNRLRARPARPGRSGGWPRGRGSLPLCHLGQ